MPSNPMASKDDVNLNKNHVTKVGDRGSVTLAFLPNSTNIFASFSKATMKALPKRFSQGQAMKLIDVDMVNQPFLENALNQVKDLDPAFLSEAGINMQNLLKMSPSTANLDGTPLADLMTLADFTGIGGGSTELLAEMMGISASQNFISIDILKQTIADNLLRRHPHVKPDGRMSVFLSDALSDMATLVRLAQSDINGDGIDDNTGLVIEMDDENGQPQVDCYNHATDSLAKEVQANGSETDVNLESCQKSYSQELTPNVISDGYHDTPLSYSADTGSCESRNWAAFICRSAALYDRSGESGASQYEIDMAEYCNDLNVNASDASAEQVITEWCGHADQAADPNCIDINASGYDKANNRRFMKMGGFDRDGDCLPDRYAGVLASTFVQVDVNADGIDDVTNQTISFDGQQDGDGNGFDDDFLVYGDECSDSGFMRGHCLALQESDGLDATWQPLCEPLLENNGVDATSAQVEAAGTQFCTDNADNPNCDDNDLPKGGFDIAVGTLYYLPMGTKDEIPLGNPDCYPDTYPALLRGMPSSQIMGDDFKMSMPARVNATAQQGFDFSKRQRANKDSLNAENIDLYVTADEDPNGVGLQIEGLKDSTTISINFAMQEYARYQYGDQTNPACTVEDSSQSAELNDSRCLGRDSFIGLEYSHRRYDHNGTTCTSDNGLGTAAENCLGVTYQTDYGDHDTAAVVGNDITHLDGVSDAAGSIPAIGIIEDELGNWRWDNTIAEKDNPGFVDTSEGKINYRYMGKSRIWREIDPFYLEYIIMDSGYRAFANLVYYGLGHPFREDDPTFNRPASTAYKTDFVADSDFSVIGNFCHLKDYDHDLFSDSAYRMISIGRPGGSYGTCFNFPGALSTSELPGAQSLNELLWLDYDYRSFPAGFGDFSSSPSCPGVKTLADEECIDQWGASRGFHKLYMSGSNPAAEAWVGVSNFGKYGPSTEAAKILPGNIDQVYDGGDFVRVSNILVSEPDLNFYMHDLVAMVAQIRMHDTSTVKTATYSCTVTEVIDGAETTDTHCDMPALVDGAWVPFYGLTHDGFTIDTIDAKKGGIRGISQVNITKLEVDTGSGFVTYIEDTDYKVASTLDSDRSLRIEFCTTNPGAQNADETTDWCSDNRVERRLTEGDVIQITYDYVERLNEGDASVTFELNDVDLGLSQEEIQQAVLETISSPEGKGALLDIADGLFTNASGQPDIYMDRKYAGGGEFNYYLRYFYPDGNEDSAVVAQQIAAYENITLGFYKDEGLSEPFNEEAGDCSADDEACRTMVIRYNDKGELIRDEVYFMDTSENIYRLKLSERPSGNEIKFDWERIK